MHNLLEDYILELASQLQALPQAKRTEELREIGQHLQNAVTVYRERGQAEDEAVKSAIAQFGTPDDLGESIVQSWRRGESIRRRDIAKSAVCTLLLSWLLARLLAPLIDPHILQDFQYYQSRIPFVLIWVVITLWQTPAFLLAGGISGCMFPKRAVAGAVIGVSILSGMYLIHRVLVLIQAPIRHQETATDWYIDFSLNLMSNIINDGMHIIAAIIGAWAGSRLRERRSQLARG